MRAWRTQAGERPVTAMAHSNEGEEETCLTFLPSKRFSATFSR